MPNPGVRIGLSLALMLSSVTAGTPVRSATIDRLVNLLRLRLLRVEPSTTRTSERKPAWLAILRIANFALPSTQQA
jgi:hypothetical protein